MTATSLPVVSPQGDDEDGYEDEDAFEADTGSLEGQYKGILGASTAQQVIRKNTEAWKAFFRLKKQYRDDSNTSVTEHPDPPGFRGHRGGNIASGES